MHQTTIEALLNRCNPITGEFCRDAILNETPVREMLAWALEFSKAGTSSHEASKKILKEAEIEMVMNRLLNLKLNVTPAMIQYYFLGTRVKRLAAVFKDPLFGSISREVASRIRLEIEEYLQQNHPALFGPTTPIEKHPFFIQPVFNHLPAEAVTLLEEDITRIPIIRKGTSLTPDIMKIRKTHPRSHEPWNKFETTLLDKALDYTNDLEFLARIFKRGTNSIYISAVKLLALKEMNEAPTTEV
jgi:hypothetical protein